MRKFFVGFIVFQILLFCLNVFLGLNGHLMNWASAVLNLITIGLVLLALSGGGWARYAPKKKVSQNSTDTGTFEYGTDGRPYLGGD